MMLIGIIGKPSFNQNRNVILAYQKLCDRFYEYNTYPIVLIPRINVDESFNKDDLDKIKKTIDICDGIVLQGGEKYSAYDLEIAKYLYEKDIPTLGICLGMQIMGKALNGKVISGANHVISERYCHPVIIDKNSKLYEIIGKEKIGVNSLHNDHVIETSLSMVAFNNQMVEAIEDKNKKFFMGVQWHPELLYDENSSRLFKSFIDSCRK